MLRRVLVSVALATCAAGTSTFAAERATFILVDGERQSGTLVSRFGPRENLTLGHEAVGVVYAVGSEVKSFKPGDRVVIDPVDDVLQISLAWSRQQHTRYTLALQML